jgi:N-acetyl-alpha-D-muramate 1-phosphate uridylyltransferase
MRAMILAAGRGERMRPLTDNTPKPLLKVGGKPLIVWHLESIANAGIKEVVINHAHLGKQIVNALGNGHQWGVSIQYSAEEVALETAGGIANALPLLGDQPFLVVNGDIFTDMDFSAYQEVVKNMQQQNQLAHLFLVDNPPQHAKGDFALSKSLVQTEGQMMLTFSGVGIYQPELFADIELGQPAKLAPVLRKAMVNQQVSGEHFQGIWHDIGTPERLATLDAELSHST